MPTFAMTIRCVPMTLLMVGAVQLGMPEAALAHGPSRKKVEETVTINASPDKVWKIMGNFQDMSWLPGVKSTTGTGGNSVDPKDDDKEIAHRTITLDDGGKIEEGLYKYDAAEHSYSYRIDKVDVKVLPVNDYSSTIKVESADGGKSVVTWKGAFYRGYMNNDPPPELDDAASQAAVQKIYKAGLANLKKKVEAGS